MTKINFDEFRNEFEQLQNKIVEKNNELQKEHDGAIKSGDEYLWKLCEKRQNLLRLAIIKAEDSLTYMIQEDDDDFSQNKDQFKRDMDSAEIILKNINYDF